MNAEWTPMRWPGSWKSPSAVGLLKGTPINWLLVDRIADLAPVVEQAKQAGLHVAEIAAPPAGVALLKGEWPGDGFEHGGCVRRRQLHDPEVEAGVAVGGRLLSQRSRPGVGLE